MYFYGSFLTQKGAVVTVHILTNGDRSRSVEIGGESGLLYFTTSPVEIRHSVNDSFDHLLRSQATIRFLTRDFMRDFFCISCMDAVVNIYREDKCIFAGFIEPRTYSQPYNELYDELEINCIDALSALQYHKYGSIGTPGHPYDTAKANARQVSFHEAVTGILDSVMKPIDIIGGQDSSCFYDGSKSIDSNAANRHSIFRQLSVSELLFMEDDEEKVWSADTVLEELLRYLNLHIRQDGFDFYIFSWESVTAGAGIEWRDIVTGDVQSTKQEQIEIATSIVAGTDTQISIDEVYNQISVTCDVRTVDTLVESPLEDSSLTSPYTNKQKYVTEYSVEGDLGKAMAPLYIMTHGGKPDYEKGNITDWFIQVKDNSSWRFPDHANGNDNVIDVYCCDNAHQEALPNSFTRNPQAAIIAMGKVSQDTSKKDNSPVSRVDMTNYLIIGVNGNGKDKETEAYPNNDSLRCNIPMAIYNGSTSGGVFSPADDDTTNYIVLSGSIVLNPIMEQSGNLNAMYDKTSVQWIFEGLLKPVPCRNNKDGRFYLRKYWKADTPFSTPERDENTDDGLVPFSGTGQELYEFKYSAIGDANDNISKIAVLSCMLIVGDKCVVETGTSGQTSDFEWRPFKTLDQCADEDEYYQQSFTIGFDPKIGDKLIGTEFDLQNNISYELGIDAEGIAIPIKKSDRISGPVRFMILGPVNTLWGEVTRRHPTFFRHTKWTETSVPLLAHVSNILIKSFEMKIYSDNGFIANLDGSDLVYVSDTDESFVNPKDDIPFKIHSALTADECRQLGVSNTVSLSTPLSAATGYGLLSIYDRTKGVSAKPEKLYVDSYYTECHRPRVVMTQKLDDVDEIVNPFYHYIHPALGKRFYVQGISRNLMESYADLTLKEVWP